MNRDGKKMILTITIFFGFLLSTVCAQEIEYTYDAAGNRIKKEFIISGSTNSPGSTSFRNKESLTDKIDSISVKIFPNPTQGIVNLQIDNTSIEDYSSTTIKVIDISGSILYENRKVGQNVKIDFENFSNGIYILQLQNNENISNWRIIKQ
jgi:hypothetical protein